MRSSPAVRAPDSPGPTRGEAPLLDFRGVSVVRGRHVVLRDLDLSIGIGEHVAILGPNGSGKSTLIRTITGEFYPLRAPGASLRIMGQESWDVFALRRMLGIVTPDLLTRSPPEVTGLEAVLSGFTSGDSIWWGHQAVTAEMERRARAALERLRAGALGGRPVREMSSGELRRIQIARALVHDPAALLLDEPSTNLDLFAQAEVRDALRRLAASGTGLVLVTHHLADIIPEIERVIFLDGGRVAADGPKRELLTVDRLEKLFGVRVEMTIRDGYYHAW
jgi:iron complex transport system ATP-binding protein